jgi:hypothetical protein
MGEQLELTDEQIENWRKMLVSTLGPYVLIMPRETIIEMRKRMQEKIEKWGKGKQEASNG